jgi:ABC-2 type transport system permease protein
MSNMTNINKVFSIARLMLLEAVRDRSIWIQMIIIPVLLTTIMGLAFGDTSRTQTKVTLLVVDDDRSDYSRMLTDQLRTDRVFNIKVESKAKARDQVKNGSVSGALIIPVGYGNALRLGKKMGLILLNIAGSADAPAQKQIISGLADRYSTNAYAAAITVGILREHGRLPAAEVDNAWTSAFKQADKAWSPAPVTVHTNIMTASGIRGKKTLAFGFSQTSIGFAIMFIMFMLINGATSILEERQRGTLGRLLTTPTSKFTFLSGKIVGLFAIALIQATILIAAGRFIFGVDWGREPLPLIVILLVFIFAIASLGILIAAFARTTNQAQSVAPILVISAAMIGGCYWPIEITPPLMQTAARFLPTYWAMTSLTDIIVRGHSWDAILLPAAVLLGFGALFLTLGIRFLKYE